MNRLSRTTAPTFEESDASAAERERNGPDPSGPVPTLRGTVGYELPIFVRSNSAAVQLCQSILDGTVFEFPSCAPARRWTAR